MTLSSQIDHTISFLETHTFDTPEIGLILGSGLSELGDEIQDPTKIKYHAIPGFKTSTVDGHSGQLILGQLNGVSVFLMQGRYHLYEGYNASEIIYPVYVMQELGIETMIVTNASGGITDTVSVGDLVLLEDHINLQGTNPLIGPNESEIGPRFVDMTYAYSDELRDLAFETADSLDIELKSGVYAATTGPSYETPAEVKMLDTIGADLVGMSTVPEVIAANHAGMNVLGISCVTNMAAGILDEPLNHEEVIETTEKRKPVFKRLVQELIADISEKSEF